MKLQSDLREFVELLRSRGVDFIVVGAHALAFHGHPRFTGDIDLWLRPTAKNAQRVVAALDEFGFGGVGLTTEDFTQPGQVVQLGRPPNRIDLLTEITGVTFDAAWSRRVAGELDGVSVSFLGRDDLVANKRATGRTKDAADVEAIED